VIDIKVSGDPVAIDECTKEWLIMSDAIMEYIRTTKDTRNFVEILDDFQKWARSFGRDASESVAWA
jgi:hypothetical protein